MRIGPTAAEVARHCAIDLFITWSRVAGKERLRGKHLTWRAIAALNGVVTDERILDRIELSVDCQSFDRQDLFIPTLDCQRQTGIDWFAIRENRAGTTFPQVTNP